MHIVWPSCSTSPPCFLPGFDVNAFVSTWISGQSVRLPLVQAGIAENDPSRRAQWFVIVDRMLDRDDMIVSANTVIAYMALLDCPAALLDKMVRHPSLKPDETLVRAALDLALATPSRPREKACVVLMAATRGLGGDMTLSDTALRCCSGPEGLSDMLEALVAGGRSFCVSSKTVDIVLKKWHGPRLLEYLMRLFYHSRIVHCGRAIQQPVKDERVAALLRLCGF